MVLGAIVYDYARKGTPSWKKQEDAFRRAGKEVGFELSFFDGNEALSRVNGEEDPFDFVYLFDYDPFLASAFSAMGLYVYHGSKSVETTHDLALLYLHLDAFEVPHPRFYASFDPKGTSLSPLYDSLKGAVKAKGLSYPYCVRARFGEQDVRPSLLLTDLEFNAFLVRQGGKPFVAEESIPGETLLAYVVDRKCALVLERRPSGDRASRSELLSKTKLDCPAVRKIAEQSCKAIGVPFGMVCLTYGSKGVYVTGVTSSIRTVAPFELTGIDLAPSLLLCFKKWRKKQPIYATPEEIRRFDKMAKAARRSAKGSKKPAK